MKKYVCLPCKFSSNNTYDFKKHLKTNKHNIINVTSLDIRNRTQKNGSLAQKNGSWTQKNGSKNRENICDDGMTCSYCNKQFCRKKNVIRHHKICKAYKKVIEMRKIEKEENIKAKEKKKEEKKKAKEKKKKEKRRREQKRIKREKRKLEKMYKQLEIEKKELERELVDFMKKSSFKGNTVNNNTICIILSTTLQKHMILRNL